MKKLLFIGIDSADSILVERFKDKLPNLSRLKKESPQINIESVFPPDSDTAWASISTGLNPAQHGVVDFVDPLNKSMKIQHVEKDNTKIKYKTFWDVASKNGKKVCVINPHLGYPTWEVNGVMVGRSSIEDKIDTYPKDLIQKYPELYSLIPKKGFPGTNESLRKYAESYKELVKNETKIGVRFINEFEWDLFFIYSSALDAIQHYFWNYTDIDDVQNTSSKFKDIILEFYILYDEMIGKLVSEVNKDTIIIIASDHGHGQRPIRLFNVNEYLRMKGYLSVKPKQKNPGIYMVEKSKRLCLDIVSKYKLESIASKILKLFPIGKKIYTTPLSIDWTRTLAYTSDLSGIKSYSYGGILINKNNLNGLNYEELRSSIISDLIDIRDPDTKEKIVKWACKREELYHGEYIDVYPDVLFDLKYGFGAGWSTECSLFSDSKTSNFVPGSHRGDTPILYVINKNLEDGIYIKLNDIYYIINSILN